MSLSAKSGSGVPPHGCECNQSDIPVKLFAILLEMAMHLPGERDLSELSIFS